jgi:hypothetical protein
VVRKDWKGVKFVLQGNEGFYPFELEILELRFPNGRILKYPRKKRPIRIILEVVGLEDDIATIRGWA